MVLADNDAIDCMSKITFLTYEVGISPKIQRSMAIHRDRSFK